MRVLLKLLFDWFNRKTEVSNGLCVYVFSCNTCPDADSCFDKVIEEIEDEQLQKMPDVPGFNPPCRNG
jgi:hypothetical protein